jgi:hypothetical protein
MLLERNRLPANTVIINQSSESNASTISFLTNERPAVLATATAHIASCNDHFDCTDIEDYDGAYKE